MRYVLIILSILLVAVMATAASEGVYAVDTAVRLIPGATIGPNSVDVWSQGTANVRFYWKDYDTGASPATVVASSPNYALRADRPRHFPFTSGPDSMYVDLVGSTEVIVTW